MKALEQGRKRSLERNLWLCVALCTVTQCFAIVVPTMLLMYQARGISFTEVTRLDAVFAFVIVLCQIPTGYAADVTRRKNLVVAAAFSVLAGAVVLFFAGSFWEFALGEVLTGFAMAALSGAQESIPYESLTELGREHEFSKWEGRVWVGGLSVAADGTGTPELTGRAACPARLARGCRSRTGRWRKVAVAVLLLEHDVRVDAALTVALPVALQGRGHSGVGVWAVLRSVQSLRGVVVDDGGPSARKGPAGAAMVLFIAVLASGAGYVTLGLVGAWWGLIGAAGHQFARASILLTASRTIASSTPEGIRASVYSIIGLCRILMYGLLAMPLGTLTEKWGAAAVLLGVGAVSLATGGILLVLAALASRGKVKPRQAHEALVAVAAGGST